MTDPEARVVLPGSARNPVPGARKTDSADPNELITVSVYVRPSASLPDAQEISKAARVSREEFAAKFGADPNDVQKVSDFAQRHGLQVSDVDLARRWVLLSGPVGAFSNAFGVQLFRYEDPEATYRGREGAITVPAELDGIVISVHGLDNRPAAQPHVRVGTAARPAQAGGPYNPTEVATGYDFPTPGNGSGECVAIIELGGGYRPNDLQQFFTNLGITPPTVTDVSVDNGTNSPGGNADLEVVLDIEVVGAVAPGAKIAVYFAPNSDQGFIDAVTTATHDATNKPSVISISWGTAEVNWSGQSMTTMDQAFQTAALLGVTVCAATGDNGSGDGVADGLAHADFPASSPHALACGGTTLNANGSTITSEVAWSGSGGGISDVFALPAYQQGAGVPPSINPGGRVGRGLPDVSGDADPGTGYVVVLNGANTTVGGTSAVAPLWAGLIAKINSALGSTQGLIQTALYASPGSMHDITSGSNGGYNAGPGWDACTGLGSPDGQLVLHACTTGATEMQMVGIGSDGQLYHTVRHTDGSWQNFFGLIEGVVSGGPTSYMQIGTTGALGELQCIGLGSDGQLYHTIRHNDGSWQNFFGLVEGAVSGGPPNFTDIAIAGVGTDMQAIGVGSDGQLWHTIRHPDGSWQNFFGLVEGVVSGGPPQFQAIATAGVAGELELVALGSDGQLWHTIRHADGSWQNFFGLIEGVVTGGPASYTDVAAGSVAGELQVVGLGSDGQLYHTIRHADGSWQNFFGLIEGVVSGGPPSFTDVGAAGVAGELQLVGLGSDGQLWHTIRHADGTTWQNFFGLIEGVVSGGPPKFGMVSNAGTA